MILYIMYKLLNILNYLEKNHLEQTFAERRATA